MTDPGAGSPPEPGNAGSPEPRPPAAPRQQAGGRVPSSSGAQWRARVKAATSALRAAQRRGRTTPAPARRGPGMIRKPPPAGRGAEPQAEKEQIA